MAFLSLPLVTVSALRKESAFNCYFTQVLFSLDGHFNFLTLEQRYLWNFCQNVIIFVKLM